MKTREEKIALLQQKSKKEGSDAKWRQVAEWNRAHAAALDDFVAIAGHIRHALKYKKWTQKDLAEKLEVSPQALSRIMKGRQNLSLQSIRKIEAVLGVKLISVHKEEVIQFKTKMHFVSEPVGVYAKGSSIFSLKKHTRWHKDARISTPSALIGKYSNVS